MSIKPANTMITLREFKQLASHSSVSMLNDFDFFQTICNLVARHEAYISAVAEMPDPSVDQFALTGCGDDSCPDCGQLHKNSDNSEIY